MDERSARKLKVGDPVTWSGKPPATGTVIEIGYLGVKISWDDGQVVTMAFADMALVESEQPR